MPNYDYEFDQLFRDRLAIHSAPVRGEVWRRVQEGIGRRRRRRFLFWPFLAAVGITGAVLFLEESGLPYHRSSAASTKILHPAAGNPVNHYVHISPSAAKSASFSRKVPQSDSHPYPPALPSNRTGHSVSTPRMGSRSSARTPNSVSSRYSARTLNSAAARPSTISNGVGRPDRSPSVALPSLAQLSGLRADRPFPALHVPMPVSPNPDAGASFFDHFYLSLFGSADFPNAYFRFGETGGFRVTYQFSKHWSATTGLQYSQINIRHNEYDSFQSFNLGFRSLDLPVLIGYSFHHERYALTIDGGMSFALHAGFNSWPDAPKRHGPLLDLAYTRRLTSQWSVYAEPWLQYFFIKHNEDLLPPHTLSVGLQVGLRYHL